MVDAIVNLLTFEGSEFLVRGDGYWSLTEMCKAHGRKVNDFLRLGSTQAYLADFNYDVPEDKRPKPDAENPVSTSSPYSKVDTGNPVSLVKPEGIWVEPIEVTKGGRSHEQGTWGHPEVTLKLAAWIKPRLEVWVYRTTMKLLTVGQVRLEEELDGLKMALAKKDEQLEEISNDYALLEHQHDRHKYIVDELKRDMHWHRMNSWGGRDT